MLPSTSRNILQRAQSHRQCKNLTKCRGRTFSLSPHPSAAFRPVAPVRDATQLRNVPFSRSIDVSFQSTKTRTALAQYNSTLDRLSNQSSKFPECVTLAAQMKAAGIQPDIHTYTYLLRSAAESGMSQEAWAIMDDMRLMQVTPDKSCFHNLLRAQRFRDANFMWNAWDMQSELNIQPIPASYSHILDRFIQSDRLEFALQFLHTMREQGIIPELRTAQSMVVKAAKMGFPRLALDLLDSFEKDSARRLDHEVWMNCLISSAESLYADGVVRSWKVIVQELHLAPDEGLCTAVLHTAARNGLPDLATDALRVLKVIGCQWQEHHFAPVVEAFVRVGQIKESLALLDIMRKSGIAPVPETTLPILHTISQDGESIDKAWTLIDQMHKGGSPIDAAALNIIIQASANSGDLQRAIGTYKAFEDYKVQPDIHTFNFLLEGCLAVGHRQLGGRLLVDLKQAKIKPDRETYINMVLLCLTQEEYEEAFYYFEEMKVAKYKPPLLLYESIIRRCLADGDNRYRIALDEMKEVGYPVSSALRKDIELSSRGATQREPTPHAPVVGLDGAAQRFIETGGL